MGTSAIVQAVVTLAHTLGMTVTAEGVETADQLVRVRTLNCYSAQGYFLAEPLSAASASARLTRSGGRSTRLRRLGTATVRALSSPPPLAGE